MPILYLVQSKWLNWHYVQKVMQAILLAYRLSFSFKLEKKGIK